MPSCNDCYYYSVEKQQKCRRFPPPNSAGGWPTVQPTDLCGEHRYGSAGSTIGATIAANEAKAAASKATETKFEPIPVPVEAATVPKPPATPPQPSKPSPPPPVTPASVFPVPTKPLASKPVDEPPHKHPKPSHTPHRAKPKSHHR